ncbi:Putrescine importer PuuP [Bacillus sp. MUM 116]|uniref:APC family permease n=1 Tax=Bacillus sp. MUM 116 TaxID=1678002 RepID=UPI0008F5CBE4|nr:APC family permease [Bacillus sp. MUM 116]OIK13414.1 Putrescine importer PuuP [Bacillus sp. MUM 116]
MENEGSLKRSLTLWHIVVIGIGFMAPTVVFDTFGIVSKATDGHVPAGYLFTAIAILFTAGSYRKMVRVFPTSGSAYTYVQKTMNPTLGFMVGWAALLDYLFTPMINALVCSIYVSTMIPQFPVWLTIIFFVLVTTLTNIFSVKFSVSVNFLFVIWQFIAVFVFIALCLTHLWQANGPEGLFALDPLYSNKMKFSLLMSGAALLAFSFLGFDAVTTLAEETKDPKKTIPNGILLIVFMTGALFITASYFEQSALSLFPKIKDLEGTSSILAKYLGGIFFQSMLFSASLTSTFASAMISQTSASRILYAMGKDDVLPRKLFGYIHPRFGTPVYNIILLGLISLTAIFLTLEAATSFITFGALTAFTFVNLSVFFHYIIKKRNRGFKSVLNYFVSPFIGTSLMFFLWINLNLHSLILGISWAVIGIFYLLILKQIMKKDISKLNFEA